MYFVIVLYSFIASFYPNTYSFAEMNHFSNKSIANEKYEYIGEYSHNVAIAGNYKDDYGYIFGTIIDIQGNTLLPNEWWIDDTSDIVDCEDIIILIDKNHKNQKFGFFDKQSGFYQEPLYDGISFRTRNDEALIAICTDDKWGFCRRNDGKLVIPCIYDDFEDFRHHYAIGILTNDDANQLSDRYLLIDYDGKPVLFPNDVFPVTPPNESGFLIIMKVNSGMELWGIGTINGDIVVDPYNVDFVTLLSEIE